MPRKKMELPPLKVIRREEYEDDENYYVVEYYNWGGKNTDIHPKNPEIPKDKLLNEILVPILITAWNRPSVQKKLAEEKALKEQQLKELV